MIGQAYLRYVKSQASYPWKRKYREMADSTTVFATGTLYWPKIVGDRALHPNYDGDAREWSYEFEPDDPSFLKEHRLLDRLKEPKGDDDDRGPYLVLRKPEFDRDGNKNDPIRIYTSDNEPWGDETLIGNGTRADVKLRIVDWGKGKKKGIYTNAIRVQELVPYVSNEFGAMDGDGDSAPTKPKRGSSKSQAKNDSVLDDLDDDIPFGD